ncbi:MAG: class I SAM-dependent methyltransferase [Pirellulales bacterium]|nr:class I SAM-dependent methyltransferase [Pirellulales bacterium]
MNTAEYATMYRVEDRHWWYRQLRRVLFFHLDRYLPGWRTEPILDAGCGTGRNLAELGNPLQHVGVDLSPDALEFCRQRGLTNVRQADVAQLPFDDGSFAAVVSTSVLYHQWVPDPGRVLDEFRRVLRTGGSIFLELPAFEFLASPHDEAVMTARRFTRGSARRLIEAHGFRLRRATYWNTLLFPLAVAARTLRLSRGGRDFEAFEHGEPWTNRVFDAIMRAEFALLKRFDLPFGVSLALVAERRD